MYTTYRYPAMPVNRTYRPRLYQGCNYFIRAVFKTFNKTILCFSQSASTLSMFCVAYIPLTLDHCSKPNTRLYTLLNATLNLLNVGAL